MNKRVKVVFAGQSGVGKSSIIYRFDNRKLSNLQPTVGAGFLCKKILDKDGNNISIDIWDTAGQERYYSMAPFYFRGAAYCILVFDLCDIETFIAIEKWKRISDGLETQTPVYFLVGNKTDLSDHHVSKNQIDIFCLDNNITKYIETSAFTGYGIEDLYNSLTSHIINSDDLFREEDIILSLDNNCQIIDDNYCYC